MWRNNYSVYYFILHLLLHHHSPLLFHMDTFKYISTMCLEISLILNGNSYLCFIPIFTISVLLYMVRNMCVCVCVCVCALMPLLVFGLCFTIMYPSTSWQSWSRYTWHAWTCSCRFRDWMQIYSTLALMLWSQVWTNVCTGMMTKLKSNMYLLPHNVYYLPMK